MRQPHVADYLRQKVRPSQAHLFRFMPIPVMANRNLAPLGPLLFMQKVGQG